jgi:dipeptidyl aminopeptidase/acylaminoacyl peptidase
MTYRALTMTDRFKAAAVGSGSADLALNVKSRPEMERVFKTLIPDYARRPQEALAERSAVRWTGKIAKNTPLLLMHGSADWRVPTEEAFEMAQALFQSNHPFRFVLFEGGEHGLGDHSAESNRILLNRFNDYLRDGKKWPSLDPHGQ